MSRIIRPQKGPQERFLSTSANIAVYGGAAGGGKTFALLMEPLRYINVQDYRAVIFRRNYTQISVSGGLWDESVSIYSGIKGAVSSKSPKYHWTFAKRATLYFDYLGRDEDVQDWQGSQITFIGFDELTHFTERQFFYMLSRNRSTCGVEPYVRATCNPDADSWVAKLIEWWIDQETGYPIKERSGKIRYMARHNETIVWGDTREELIEQGIKPSSIKSFTFIASTLQDNQVLMQLDPSYLANLEALPLVERERLLYGNWKIKSAAGLFFNRNQVGNMLPVVPRDVTTFVRAWDLAATSETEGGEPAYTAGVLMGRRADGRFIVIDVINVRQSAGEVRALIKRTAITDNAIYGNVKVRLPQDPGQAGKAQAQSFALLLAGLNFRILPVTGSKETRAEPAAAQWQAGNFDVVVADWNDEYFSQLESFPSSKFKDMVDATSDAFSELVQITERDKLVYPAFSESENVYTETTADSRNANKYRRYIAVGYGSAIPMVYLEILDNGDVARVESEYYSKDRLSDGEYLADFEEFAGRAEEVVYVTINEEAEAFKNLLRNRGYRVRVVDDDLRKSISKVDTMFALNKLLINQECERLISELKCYIWDEKAAERGEEKPVKANSAACEALREAVASVVYRKRRFE
ncbi:MAG: phage terminase large subunit [Eubacterium sp.]|nr:phage terminase large subunit [Eubacterium sp.]